jgi:nanoRNase/pAp phosphatase (c-di-AMP/oligoRNAs hydrolase)
MTSNPPSLKTSQPETQSLQDAVEPILQAIHQRLAKAQRILLLSHIRPDGDAIGSTLGLGLALKEAGKYVQMTLVDGVPQSFRHLEGSELISRSVGDLHRYDTIIVQDCSDLQRVGTADNGVSVLNGRKPILGLP